MDHKDYILVIGAANIDIGGTPYKPLISGDSNPGIIKMSFGGVGRNIAHNLALLGADVKLVTAVGDDILGTEMMESCRSLGIDTDLSITVPGALSSMYIFINDDGGEMDLALSHVEIVEYITPKYIESIKDQINEALAVVTDCNISQDSLYKIMEICEVPLYVDTVSVSHADKIKGHLNGIDTIKPNLIEAEFLTDTRIENEYSCLKAARILIEQGIKRVFISLGPQGILAADKNRAIIVGRYPAEIKSTTGAGDSAMASIIYYSMNGVSDPLTDPAKAANAAAAATISIDTTIHPEMSISLIEKIMRENDVNIKDLKEIDQNE
ncbi:MAG: carbohydrate kinase family protein [Mogibacterium sp.]|nr:carbohydrate kinase family protein [Mogibacterium sp.]